MILFSRLRMEEEEGKRDSQHLENRIRSKDRKVAASAAPASLVSSSVHHGVASKGEGSNERSLPVRQWPTKRETIRCISTRPHRRSRPSSRAPPPISRPSFSLTLRRMKERKREKSPCKSMDPRLFCAEQSFVSFLSR